MQIPKPVAFKPFMRYLTLPLTSTRRSKRVKKEHMNAYICRCTECCSKYTIPL